MRTMPFLSIFTAIISMFFLIYFWLPLFFILFIVIIAYIGLMWILSLLTNSPTNINVIKIKRYSSENHDYIDTTTADKDTNKNK